MIAIFGPFQFVLYLKDVFDRYEYPRRMILSRINFNSL